MADEAQTRTGDHGNHADHGPDAEDDAARVSMLAQSLNYYVGRFSTQHARSELPRLPLAPAEGRAVAKEVVVLPLGTAPDDAGWDELHKMFTKDRLGNLRPWYRCLGLLRGHQARTVIIERRYVCLDYRSEFASFYAQVDEQRPSTAVRLHFFASEVDEAGLDDLTRHTKDYLGYIVARRGALPLVGRTVIRVPTAYIEHAATITESVNLLGQKLTVEGVPFMQQDRSFAVCADVTIWGIHYAAHRRGLAERRLIADIVALSSDMHPLRPRAPNGLTPNDAAEVLGQLGFRTILVESPTIQNLTSTLPKVELAQLPGPVRATLIRLLGLTDQDLDDLDGPDDRDGPKSVTELLEGQFVSMVTDRTAAEVDNDELATLDDDIVRAIDVFLAFLICPYVRSRMPVYAATSNHSLTVCGHSGDLDEVRFYVHDDQNGPYLEASSLVVLSDDDLDNQSGWDTTETADLVVPPVDPLLDRSWRAEPVSDHLRAVESLVFAGPARATLTCWDAVAEAVMVGAGMREVMAAEAFHEALATDPTDQPLRGKEGADTAAPADTDTPADTADTADAVAAVVRAAEETYGDTVHVRSCLTMGIDYKNDRRQQARTLDDEQGRDTFSSANLSEWVVVVEGTGDDDTVLWELVFDATSSAPAPRLLLARTGEVGVVATPGSPDAFREAPFDSANYIAVHVPSSVGKVRQETATGGGGRVD